MFININCCKRNLLKNCSSCEFLRMYYAVCVCLWTNVYQVKPQDLLGVYLSDHSSIGPKVAEAEHWK